ncbi:MAG TPA: LamB/YcsF family protein, partial [Pelagibacterales bacterium]|nr:LamB/YcsF family protein [Pelagibacterales bacterium]
MEVNLNCDLGEKSEHYSGINDQALIEIINTANIACGYHAGSESVIETTIKIAKEN